jgi:hypothetical protein
MISNGELAPISTNPNTGLTRYSLLFEDLTWKRWVNLKVEATLKAKRAWPVLVNWWTLVPPEAGTEQAEKMSLDS